jgi:hypothetical protein
MRHGNKKLPISFLYWLLGSLMCEVFIFKQSATLGQIKHSLHEYGYDFGPTFEGHFCVLA